MTRRPLSTITDNVSRAEKLALWKESRASASDVKKRTRPDDSTADETRKKRAISLKDSLAEKEKKIVDLERINEQQRNDLGDSSAKTKQLEEDLETMARTGEVMQLQIDQLKDVLRHALKQQEADQDHIVKLTEQCGENASLRSHLVELSLINECTRDTELPMPEAKQTPMDPLLEISSGRINDLEKDALESEIRVLHSKNGFLSAQCEELRLSESLLMRQNAEIIENGIQFMGKRDAELRRVCDQERQELTETMNSSTADLTEALEKSLKKIVRLQKELADLKQN